MTYLKKHHATEVPRLFQQMTPNFELEILNLLLLSVDEKIVNSFASALDAKDRQLWKTVWMDRVWLETTVGKKTKAEIEILKTLFK